MCSRLLGLAKVESDLFVAGQGGEVINEVGGKQKLSEAVEALDEWSTAVT